MPAQRQVELYHPGKLTEAILEFDRSRTSSGSGATKGLEIERDLQGKVGPEAHLESAGGPEDHKVELWRHCWRGRRRSQVAVPGRHGLGLGGDV